MMATNVILITGILILAAGSTLLFLCSIPDAFFLSALGQAGMALGDLTAQALIGLVLDSFRLENGVSVPGVWRGLYFLIWAVVMLSVGPPLRRWLGWNRVELSGYRKTLPVLLIPMLLSMICFQQFPVETHGHWAVFLLCCTLLFLVYWLDSVKHEAEHESEMLKLEMSLYASGCQELSRVYNELAVLVHDTKNHLRVISAMLDEDKPEEVMAYISRITEEIKRGTLITWCNHEIGRTWESSQLSCKVSEWESDKNPKVVLEGTSLAAYDNYDTTVISAPFHN